MNRHLILHIGLSKTGSSSIQRILAGQRPAMEALGIYYPTSPGWANHALLPASLVNDPRILWGFHPGTWEGLTPAARLARFRDEWSAEMAALPDWATRCVISAEQIAGLLRSQEEVDRLAETLRPYFATTRVIAYIRRQDQHLASAYSQWMRGGVLHDPEVPPGGPESHFEYDYGALLGRYAQAFGASSVLPRIFSRDSLVGGDVVEDFFDAAGFTLPIPEDAPKKNSNLGITAEGQALMLRAGRSLAARDGGNAWRDTPEWRRLAESVSEALPGRGWRPTREAAREFVGRFAQSNEQARAQYFPESPSLFSTDFSDLPEHTAPVADAAIADAAIAVLMHEVARSAQREAECAMAQFRLFKKLDDRKGMRTAVVRAIKYAPGMLGPRLRAAEFFLAEGDLRQAREHALAAQRIAPEEPRLAALLRRTAKAREDAAA